MPVAPRPLHRRQWIGVAMLAAGGVLLLAGVWLGVTALGAGNQLNDARTEVSTLRAQILAGKWTAAQATAEDLAQHAHRANQLTTGPVWAAAAALPNGGEPLRTIRGITASVDSLGQEVLPQLVRIGEGLDPRTLRRPNGGLDLSRILEARPALASASTALDQSTKAISGLPPDTWLSPIDAARADVVDQITALDDAVRSTSLAVKVLPTMLGREGLRHYVIAFQNEAEARGTGGLAGAFALVDAKHGKLTLNRVVSQVPLGGISADVNFGSDYEHLYEGSTTTTLYGNANLSPHFPYAAQIWASMWQKHTGERVDGVIAVDPTALSYLLSATGPATLADRSRVSAKNVVALTQSTVYAKFSDLSSATQTRRREYLAEIASVVSKKILDAHSDPAALARAAGKAIGERRLLVWSAEPTIQADLSRTAVSGVIPSTKAPYVGLFIVSNGGNKLDYYLDRSLTWRRTGCESIRQTTVTITLTNKAPASGLSPYVTGRQDRRSYPVKTGDSRLGVYYLATEGARMEGVTVAGRPGTASIGAERGHPVYVVDLELPRGTSRTIVLRLNEPAGQGKPIVLRQPLVRPLRVALEASDCP